MKSTLFVGWRARLGGCGIKTQLSVVIRLSIVFSYNVPAAAKSPKVGELSCDEVSETSPKEDSSYNIILYPVLHAHAQYPG